MTASGPSHVSPGEKIQADTVNWLIDAARPSMSSPGSWRQTDNTTVFEQQLDDFVPVGTVTASSKTPKCWDPMLSSVADLSGHVTEKVLGATNCMVSWGRQLFNFGNLKAAAPLSGDVYALFTLKPTGGAVPDVKLSSGNYGSGGDSILTKDSFKMPLWRVASDGASITLDCRGMPFMPVYN